MPNHVTNLLKIDGTKEQIDAFVARFCTTKPSEVEDRAFCFERIIPMPAILRLVVSDGASVPNIQLDGSVFGAKRPATPEEIAEITATGYKSWYDWSVANWGTKWNCYSIDLTRDGDTQLTLQFDTAWNIPEPALSEMCAQPECNGLHITYRAFDEGWNFAAVGELDDGEWTVETVDATPALYEEVYGEPPETAEE